MAVVRAGRLNQGNTPRESASLAAENSFFQLSDISFQFSVFSWQFSVDSRVEFIRLAEMFKPHRRIIPTGFPAVTGHADSTLHKIGYLQLVPCNLQLSFKLNNRLIDLQAVALGGLDLFNYTVGDGLQAVFHLHGFNDSQLFSGFYFLSHFNLEGYQQARHR